MAVEIEAFEYPADINCFAGVDEVGRGPLVGNVVTAAVILDPLAPIDGLTDSKKLSEKKRLLLAEQIKQKALAWSIGACSPQEIDQYNILQASLIAMQRAVQSLSVTPEFVLVDGNKLPQLNVPAMAVVKGDLRVQEISAASILAKVARDEQMKQLDLLFPNYGFARHNGYPTKAHLEAIDANDLLYTPELLAYYRKSFGPIKRLLNDSIL